MKFKPTTFMQMVSTGLVLALAPISAPLHAQDSVRRQKNEMIRELKEHLKHIREKLGRLDSRDNPQREQPAQVLPLMPEPVIQPTPEPVTITEERPPDFIQKQLPPGLSPTRPHRGKYFLFSGSYLAFTSERSLALGSAKAQLGTNTGSGLSVAIGRQTENWTLGAEFGYFRQGYDTFNYFPNPLETASGDSRNYSFSLFVGRDFQLNHSWRIHARATLGFALRHEALGSPTLRAAFDPNYNDFPIRDEGACFQGSTGIQVDYAFSDLCSTYLGYRFTYVNELRHFDAIPINMVELGLRWNL